jgi:hypothetical protein
MPARDGTGPVGMGPGTGRGRGWCRTGVRFSAIGWTAFRGKNRWLLGLAAPVIAAAVRDLINPKGVLRHIASALRSNKRKNVPHKVSREADYTVVEEKNSRTDQEQGRAP